VEHVNKCVSNGVFVNTLTPVTAALAVYWKNRCGGSRAPQPAWQVAGDVGPGGGISPSNMQQLVASEVTAQRAGTHGCRGLKFYVDGSGNTHEQHQGTMQV
jgi:hypothetical protein